MTHLPYSTYFSLHLSISLSVPLSLLFVTLHFPASIHFLSFFQYFPSSLSLYLIIHSHSCSLFFPFFFYLLCPSVPTLLSTFLSAFFDFSPLSSLPFPVLPPCHVYQNENQVLLAK